MKMDWFRNSVPAVTAKSKRPALRSGWLIGTLVIGFVLSMPPVNLLAGEASPRLVGDGVTMNTQVFNTMIDRLARGGGGRLTVPPGHYLTGTIYLKSNVTLFLENGAVIVGSTNIADYPENPSPRPDGGRLEFGRYSLIYAVGQTNIAVTGQGIIYGQGNSPFFTKKFLINTGVSPVDAYLKRPYGLCFVGCQRVQVRNIKFENIAFWVENYLDCDGVIIEGITVDSYKYDYNNDGIDVDGSRNVTIANCYFNAGDDGICLKSSYSICENIAVNNCVIRSMANGIKFGTASRGGFKNIAIANCTVNDTWAAGLALEIVDGGVMDGVTIQNISMNEVGAAIFIHLGNRAKRWVTEPRPPPVGVLRNVVISGITATITNYAGRGPVYASSISGLPGYPVDNVTLSHIRITNENSPAKPAAKIDPTQVPQNEKSYPEYWMFGPLPAYGFFCRQVHQLVFNDVSFNFKRPDSRPAMVFDGVQDLSLSGFYAQTYPNSHPALYLFRVKDALISNYTTPGSTNNFMEMAAGCERVKTFMADSPTADAISLRQP